MVMKRLRENKAILVVDRFCDGDESLQCHVYYDPNTNVYPMVSLLEKEWQVAYGLSANVKMSAANRKAYPEVLTLSHVAWVDHYGVPFPVDKDLGHDCHNEQCVRIGPKHGDVEDHPLNNSRRYCLKQVACPDCDGVIQLCHLHHPSTDVNRPCSFPARFWEDKQSLDKQLSPEVFAAAVKKREGRGRTWAGQPLKTDAKSVYDRERQKKLREEKKRKRESEEAAGEQPKVKKEKKD